MTWYFARPSTVVEDAGRHDGARSSNPSTPTLDSRRRGVRPLQPSDPSLDEAPSERPRLTAEDDAIFDDLEIGGEDAIEGEADRMAEQARISGALWSGPKTGRKDSTEDVLALAPAQGG